MNFTDHKLKRHSTLGWLAVSAGWIFVSALFVGVLLAAVVAFVR